MSKSQKILFLVLFSFLLLNALFLRNPWLIESISGGILSIITLLILLSLLSIYLVSKKTPKPSKTLKVALVFILIASISPLISALINEESPSQALRYSIEMALMGGFIYTAYYMIVMNIIKQNVIIIIITLLGSSVALDNLLNVQELVSVRRYAGLASVNYQGNTIGVSSVLSLFLLLNNRSYKDNKTYYKLLQLLFLFCMLICGLVAFLSGSRQAILSLILGYFLVLLNYFNFNQNKYKIKNRINLSILIISFSTLSLAVIPIQIPLIGNLDITSLLNRFQLSSLQTVFNQRIKLAFGSSLVEIKSGIDLFFGQFQLYPELNTTNSAIFPHNIFISILLFSGAIALIILLIGVYLTVSDFFLIKKQLKQIKMYSGYNKFIYKNVQLLYILGVALLCSLTYALFSGRLTRTFNVFIYWGLFMGATQQLLIKIRQFKLLYD